MTDEITPDDARRALGEVTARQRQVQAAPTARPGVHVLFAALLGGAVAVIAAPPPVRFAVWGLTAASVVVSLLASDRPRLAALLGIPATPHGGVLSGRQWLAGLLSYAGIVVIFQLTSRIAAPERWLVTGSAIGLWYLVHVLVILPAVLRFEQRSR